MMRRLLPYPVLSLCLVAVWLLLQNSVAPGQLMLALVFAVLIPWLTRRFWPESSPLWRPLLTLRLTARLLWDILIANLVVARLVLGPRSGLKPAFVRVPVALDNQLALTMLAGAISLTPGTVSVDVRPNDGFILVHSLHVENVQTMVADIKRRYERPLKEIFQC
ncbi:MAG: Na+/H+ antiporter subunit E [Chromatiaceae bacterium]|jgi:multicomponent K+:H+ antiporter subunit E